MTFTENEYGQLKITKKQKLIIDAVNRYYSVHGQEHELKKLEERRHEVMMKDFLHNKRCWGGRETQDFTGNLNVKEFVKLFLCREYEVIKSAEELLLEFFNKVGDSEQKHIVKSLNILGLNIEGINV